MNALSKLKNFPVVIFCGGKGTRLGNLTKKTPKPLIKVGKYPLVVNIIFNYLKYGFKNFYLLTGYKNKSFLDYFKNRSSRTSRMDKLITFDNCLNRGFRVNILNTGLNTLKKNRLKKLKKYIKNEQHFMLTYGDGIAKVNFQDLLKFHLSHKKIGTITAVHPPSRFGEIKYKKNILIELTEKPVMSEGFINGGFFIFKNTIFKFISKNQKDFEHQVINNLCKRNQIKINFFKKQFICVDNERELKYLSKKLVYYEKSFNNW
jgi:glucose-1-phosphate cytidylyltransferase